MAMSSGPWTFAEAQERLRQASSNQAAIEKVLKEAFEQYALAEEAYRKKLAAEMIAAHNDGVAWSACGDLARGDEDVAELRRKRDIAEGVKEVAFQAAWRRVADRKDGQRFTDWSMRRELAEFHGETPEAAIEQ